MTGQFGKGPERMGPSAVGKLVRWVILGSTWPGRPCESSTYAAYDALAETVHSYINNLTNSPVPRFLAIRKPAGHQDASPTDFAPYAQWCSHPQLVSVHNVHTHSSQRGSLRVTVIILPYTVTESVKSYFIAVYFRQLVTDKGPTQLLVASIYVHNTHQARAGLSL